MRVSFICLFLASAAFAQSPASLLTGDYTTAFAYSGPSSGATAGRATLVDVEGQPFSKAWRMATVSLPEKRQASDEWSMRLTTSGAASVAKDDTVVVEFYLRCVSAPDGDCTHRFNVELGRDPWTKSSARVHLSTANWTRFRYSFRMAAAYAPREYNIAFFMGQQIQTAELGGFSIQNHGQNPDLSSLDLDPAYRGMEPGAPWRAAAAARIEKLRTGRFEVEVLDRSGRPVPNASIRARMIRHAFPFGSAVDAEQLLGTSADSEKYRAFILDNFNIVVLENDLKWPNWEWRPKYALDALDWLEKNGIRKIRGHNLVWPNWEWLPNDLKSLQGNPELLRKRINTHILDITTATRGRLYDWDVINEPYVNTHLQQILGDAEMVEWVKLAQENDPFSRKFINDYNIIAASGANLAHQQGYFSILQYLESQGAPVHGIGMQGHFDAPTDPERMLAILDRFATLGKSIAITEFDMNIDDEQLQAQFTRDLLTVCFSHPAVDEFLMWGFWEGRHWLPRGAMVRRDWSTKPNYQAWRDMVFREWWTDTTVESNSQGLARFRGYQGEYELTIDAPGLHAVVPATVTAGDSGLTVRLDRPAAKK
jgi:GH35 family endo-1,4-beta-xylanase